MATDRQIAANRSNGSLGRGPKTSAGKARSSRNALKHGLSIPINRDKTLRRQIELLARILAQSEAGNVFGQARAAEKRCRTYQRGGRANCSTRRCPSSHNGGANILTYRRSLQAP